jgi:hypothetical protein
MIEVALRPGVPGCVTMPLGCLTLGLVPFLMRRNEGHFARRMDELGVETRSGKRIAWSEFSSIKRVKGGSGMPGQGRLTAVYSDEYILESPRGRVSVPLWRAVNANEVGEFTLAHVPRHLLP